MNPVTVVNSTNQAMLGSNIHGVSATNHEQIRLPFMPTRWLQPMAGTASSSQILVVPTIKLIVPSNASKTIVEDEDEMLALLPPLARLNFVYQHNKFEFAFNLVAFLVAIASTVYAALHLVPLTLSIFSLDAAAQEPNGRALTTDSFIAPSVLALMAIVLLWCLVTVSFSAKPRNVTYAKDTMKTIVGFIVGFLSGRKSP